jgi:acyl-CoA synthetase (AMP-forming)/AMP-acid ligase II
MYSVIVLPTFLGQVKAFCLQLWVQFNGIFQFQMWTSGHFCSNDSRSLSLMTEVRKLKYEFTCSRNDSFTVIYTCSETGRYYTYDEVRKTASQFGSALKKQWAWEKGNVMALFCPNTIDTPAVTWGCQWAGGIVSPANPDYTTAELAHHLRDSGARALLTVRELLPAALEAVTAAGLQDSRVMLIGDAKDEHSQIPHFTSFLRFADPNQTRATINPDNDIAFLVYSSGTSGLPKGVLLSHTNIVSNLAMVNTVDGKMLKPGSDKIISVLPYYHIYGMAINYGIRISAAYTLLRPPISRPPASVYWSGVRGLKAV